MYPEYEDIVTNIKKLIEIKGMKQCVVAERSGITEQEFSNMLNERRKLIRIEHIPAIAHSLNVSIDELFKMPDEEER